MSKGARIRAGRNREDLLAKRVETWFQATGRDYARCAPPTHGLTLAGEETITLDPVRPCGGVEHCVTESGRKARSTHKKCELEITL